MKTAEELNALKEEVETLNKKLAELSVEELEQVAGGSDNIEAPELRWRNNTTFWAGHYKG